MAVGVHMTRLNYKAIIFQNFDPEEWNAFLDFCRAHNGKDDILWTYTLEDKWALIAMLRWGSFLIVEEKE